MLRSLVGSEMCIRDRSGKDYKEFIYECNELRQFQMITKTGYTFDDTVYIDVNNQEYKAQKVNRVFAIKDSKKSVKLFKVKRGCSMEDDEITIINNDSYVTGLPNAPKYYTISNEAIGKGITLDEINREYYIEEVEKLLVLWFGENWKERIEQAHSMRKAKNFTELPVKNYID